MRINREKVAAFLAVLVMLVAGRDLLEQTFETRRLVETNLIDPGSTGVPVEPEFYLEDHGDARDPFVTSTHWRAMEAEPLPPPPIEAARQPEIQFGWVREGGGLRYLSLSSEVEKE